MAWTLGLTLFVLLLNAGLFSWSLPEAGALLTNLQFHGVAIRQGEYWRLLTGNLVHWSQQHLLLDLSGFVVLGLLYERFFGRLYPLLLLVTALAVGIVGLVCWPERMLVRGLSGVDWGLLAAALCMEFARSRRAPSRLLWVAPAAGIFLCALIYQETTGRFFTGGALFLSSTDKPAPLAHAAGAAGALVFLALAAVTGWRPSAMSQSHLRLQVLLIPTSFQK